MEQKLKYIATLTAGNNHTGARWYVADLFPYLSPYKRRFDLILELQSIDGSLHYGLSLYRTHITNEMLNIIEQKEGVEILSLINKSL